MLSNTSSLSVSYCLIMGVLPPLVVVMNLPNTEFSMTLAVMTSPVPTSVNLSIDITYAVMSVGMSHVGSPSRP